MSRNLIKMNGSVQPIPDSQAQIASSVFSGATFLAPNSGFNAASNHFLKTHGHDFGHNSLSRHSGFMLDAETLRCSNFNHELTTMRTLWHPTFYVDKPASREVLPNNYMIPEDGIKFTPYGNYVPVLVIQQSSKYKKSGGYTHQWTRLTDLEFHIHTSQSQDLDYRGATPTLTNNYTPLLTSSGSDTRTTFKVENLRCICWDNTSKARRLAQDTGLQESDLVMWNDVSALFESWMMIPPTALSNAMALGHVWMGWIAGPDNLDTIAASYLDFTISKLGFTQYRGNWSTSGPSAEFTVTGGNTARVYARTSAGKWTKSSGEGGSLPLYLAQFGTSSLGSGKINNSRTIFRSPVFDPNGDLKVSLDDATKVIIQNNQHMSIQLTQPTKGWSWNSHPPVNSIETWQSGTTGGATGYQTRYCVGPGPLFMSLATDPDYYYDASSVGGVSFYHDQQTGSVTFSTANKGRN